MEQDDYAIRFNALNYAIRVSEKQSQPSEKIKELAVGYENFLRYGTFDTDPKPVDVPDAPKPKERITLSSRFIRVKPNKYIFLENGGAVIPVATIESIYGARFNIWVDDHCYVFGMEHTDINVKPFTRKSHHIFPELLEVLKTLPNPD